MKDKPTKKEGYAVQLTDEAVYALAEIPSEAMATRISALLSHLSRFPRYGVAFDPAYESARPPVPCLMCYCGTFGIYYHVDDEERVVTIFAIEDERRDPMSRFGEK